MPQLVQCGDAVSKCLCGSLDRKLSVGDVDVYQLAQGRHVGIYNVHIYDASLIHTRQIVDLRLTVGIILSKVEQQQK